MFTTPPSFGGGTTGGRMAVGGSGEGRAMPSTFKHGGKVKKTGLAKVHKGEKVLSKKQASKR